jgi:hypothetical protein
LGRESEFLLRCCPMPDADYFSRSLSEKISWNLERFFPGVVDWINRWLKVVETDRDDILVTTYDEFVADEPAYFERLLEFYEIPQTAFRMPSIKKSVEVSHFRVGRTDEWRDAFTAAQVRRSSGLIGADLLERFGWPPR